MIEGFNDNGKVHLNIKPKVIYIRGKLENENSNFQFLITDYRNIADIDEKLN